MKRGSAYIFNVYKSLKTTVQSRRNAKLYKESFIKLTNFQKTHASTIFFLLTHGQTIERMEKQTEWSTPRKRTMSWIIENVSNSKTEASSSYVYCWVNVLCQSVVVNLGYRHDVGKCNKQLEWVNTIGREHYFFLWRELF